MSLANVTSKTLSDSLELEIPDIYVVIAKHRVVGMESSVIAEILGVELGDITEIESTELYQLVRTQIGAVYAQTQSTRVHGWDGLESLALDKLLARMQHEKDPEFLLKVAAVANKANRRGGQDMGVLDPAKAGRTAVRLTSRLVQRMLDNGRVQETTVTKELSIHDGSMSRASYNEVADLMGFESKMPRLEHEPPSGESPSLIAMATSLDDILES